MQIDPSLIAAASAAAETIINKALLLDPAAQNKIAELESSVVRISVAPPDIAVTVQATQAGLKVSGNEAMFESNEIDVTIEGSPIALSRLVLDNDKDSLIRSGEIKLTGNTEKALKLQSLLAELDLDWEGALADIIGDIPAHFIGQRLRKSMQWGRQTHASLTANIEEYLHEESRLLPNRIELESHFSDIDTLRLAAERLEAKIQKLHNRTANDQPHNQDITKNGI